MSLRPVVDPEAVVDRYTGVPPYRQLLEILTSGIASGLYPVGGRLPSVPQLSARFGLARMTCQRALQMLASQGRAVSVPGSGFYVVDRPAMVPRIEVLVVRDPDADTEVAVWVDGEPAEVTVEVVDPGWGWGQRAWQDRKMQLLARADYSPAFRDGVREALAAYDDCRYVSGEFDD